MISLLKNHSILYVEDEIEIQKSMSKLLETYFKKVFVSTNGEEALELFHKEHPDTLLFDINLPNMSGLELTREIRKTHENTPVVLLTAYTDEEKLLNAIDLNINKYLVKPVQNKEFKDALEKIALHLLKYTNAILRLGEVSVWHISNAILYHRDKEIFLSSKETSLLSLLAKYHKECVTHETIMAIVWEEEFDKEITFDSVKNLVKNLRKKLPEDLIQSVYGRGYILL